MTFGAGSFAGKPVRRVEDPELLRGGGTYVDNLKIDGMLTLDFVRSPMPQALIRSIDTTAARAMPGIVGVYSAADLDLPDAPALMPLRPDVVRPSLAKERVHFVGEPIVAVLAESRAQAMDAAELVEIDFEPLDFVIDMEEALSADSAVQFESIGSNVMIGMRFGSDDPLSGADVVVRGRFENQRVAVVPMEGSAIAVDPTGDRLRSDRAPRLPDAARDSANLLGAARDGPGTDARHRTERRRLLRGQAPVGRRGGRRHRRLEARSPSEMGRDPVREHGGPAPRSRPGAVRGVGPEARRHDGGDALSDDRRLPAPTPSFGGILVLGQTKTMAQGVYHIPKIAFDVGIVTTNTTPMGAYRGAGRPEAAAFLERIVDMAADELGMDPVELRRKNFIQPDEFPLTTVMGANYDSGDYDAALSEVLRIADYDGLLREQAERRARGDHLQLGIGMATLCRGDRRRGGVRRGRGARGRHDHRQGGDVGPRSGPRHRVLADCGRPVRRAHRTDPLRAVRHGAGRSRWWHRRFAVGPARGDGRAPDVEAGRRAGQGPGGRSASKRRPRTSW